MNGFKKYLGYGLKGFGMGAGSVTPCVSAGTIALLTGIYPMMIDSLDALSNKRTWKALLSGRIKEFWTLVNGNFIIALTIGFAFSILALAKIVTWGLSYHPIQTWAFFFGLIVASTVLLLMGIEEKKWSDLIFTAAGIAAGIGIFCLTPSRTPDSLAFIFLCGAVSVVTMVLPGIAGSFVLQIMGKYETIMRALDFQNPDWPVLWAFFIGCVVGILAFSKFLKWIMSRWGKQTILILTGFIIGSLVRIWPYSDMQGVADAQFLRTGVNGPIELQIPSAIIFCAIGAGLVAIIRVLANKNRQV